jgi:SAM-dependent methyltransferase
MSIDSAAQHGPDPSRHARSFGQAADLYDSIRPTYPPEALEWMLGDAPKDVVDVGAGTGLLTRGVIALGHNVTGIDPDPLMLDKLTASSPGLAAAHEGSAEALPLPDASADVITVGQAFHWFDRSRALPELRRVLKPDGVLAPIWNMRDESVDWVDQLTEIIGNSRGELTPIDATETGYFAPDFGDVEIRVFRHSRPLDRDGLIRLVQSRSYYLTADGERQRELTEAVGRLADTHPDLAGKDTFAMPYVTCAFRAHPA